MNHEEDYSSFRVHKQSAICIDRNVSLAANNFLSGIKAATLRRWCLDGLAINDTSGQTLLSSLVFTIKHLCDMVNGLEQQSAHKRAEPPIYRLPRWIVVGQHPPSSPCPGHIAQRIDHIAQICFGLTDV